MGNGRKQIWRLALLVVSVAVAWQWVQRTGSSLVAEEAVAASAAQASGNASAAPVVERRSAETAAAIPWQLVYTRQPRAREPIPGTTIEEAANWQHASDVGRINVGLAEADVVIDDLAGNVKVIYDCTSSKANCVAQEARVSPDGTRIVYSVGFADSLREVHTQGVKLGIYELPALKSAQLWVYDLVTGENKPIPHHPRGAIDRQPEWLNNSKIVFASNRANTFPFRNPVSMHQGKNQFGNGRCFNAPYCASQEYGYGHDGKSMQIWTMNIDGTNARNISPHENNALAPAVMSNGDILYSCWNSHENKNFDAATAHSRNPTTSKNKWWLCRTDGNGADQTVILNGHKSPLLKTKGFLPARIAQGEGHSQLRALRSVAEIYDGKLAVTNYYRSNHVGSMGIIYGMDYQRPHVEGCSTAKCYTDGTSKSAAPGSGRYIPSSFKAITPYGTDQDIDNRRDERNRNLGKAGYPAPLPDTDREFLITHGRGSCYEVTLIKDANRKAMGGEPTCQKALYKVKVPMVTDPFDTRQMEFVAGGEEWHAFDGRAIASYQRLHGQEEPEQPPPLDSNLACYLQVVDARKAELAPSHKYNWKTNLYQQCAFQGCAVNTDDPGFHAREMQALTILLPEMWDFTYGGNREREYISYMNNMGHKTIAILGSQPLETDGSVKMRVPCETPLIMTGTDADGMVIAHDSMLHSLRKGETRTCHGCHDGHSEERAAQLPGAPLELFANTKAFNTQPPLPKKIAPITFLKDVKPILEKRCTGCHEDMNNSDGLLYSRVAQDFEQIDWPWAKKHPGHGQQTWVQHVLIKKPGQGYKAGEKLVFRPGGAAGTVGQVGPKGEITAIAMTERGNGYPALTRVAVETAGGRGAQLQAMSQAYQLSRPYTSKWVAKFARDSLLYWKCLGSRQDGRTDAKYNNDIDFGPAHESGATKAECLTIGQWIDTGIQR